VTAKATFKKPQLFYLNTEVATKQGFIVILVVVMQRGCTVFLRPL